LFSQGFRVTVVVLQQTWLEIFCRNLHNDLVYIHTYIQVIPPPAHSSPDGFIYPSCQICRRRRQVVFLLLLTLTSLLCR
jgi:hypothetical protein